MTTESLDEIALRLGTDKASNINDYCNFYEELFGHLRSEPVRILEIGVFKGHSIAMWEQAFPRSEVVGIDYNLSQLERKPERSKLFSINAVDRGALTRFASEHGPWDIIVEDSAHTEPVSQAVIDALFLGHLNGGGFMVIEDIAAHWKRYRGQNQFTQWAMNVAMRTQLGGHLKVTNKDKWNANEATPFDRALDQVILRPGIMVLKKTR